MKTNPTSCKTTKLDPTTHCPICGRPLPPKTSKRGAPKQYHKECRVFESRLGEVMSLLAIMRFQPPCRRGNTNAFCGPAREINRELHSLFQNFTVKSVRCADGENDDKEYYAEWEAAKKRRRGKG